MPDCKPPPDRHAEALKRLASELNVAVDVFLGEPRQEHVGELLTLVHLWSAIGDSEGRRRVLSVARKEAERAGYATCA